jgi:predicted nucleic acid-binding protein
MRAILDTNVLVSGIFFKGPPFRIFQMWKRGHLDLVISHEILNAIHK